MLAVALALASLSLGPHRLAQAAALDLAEQDLLARINDFRAARGLARLVVSDALTAAAKWMSADMAVFDYFGHTSRDGRAPVQRMQDAGYPAYQSYTGEDLAAGYTSTADVLAGWIASPTHYAVLVNPVYRAIGVGRAYSAGSVYGWYWTADLGSAVDARAASLSFDHGYHARWSGQSADPTLAPGETASLVVALLNTGYRGWYAGVPNAQAALGTADPLDVARPELASGWLSPNRIAVPTTAYVGPGQIGWFQFTVRAPSAPGDYTLAVRGVVDGVTWLEDQGIYFTIRVR